MSYADRYQSVIIELAWGRGWIPDPELEDGLLVEGATIAQQRMRPASKYWEHPYGDDIVTDEFFSVALYAAAEHAIRWLDQEGYLR